MSATRKIVPDEIEDSDDFGSGIRNTETYPPETAELLSWSSLRFVRSASPRSLLWATVAIILSIFFAAGLAQSLSVDVTVRSAGEVYSDLGTRYAISPITGQITEYRKRAGDFVNENEVIASFSLDAQTEKEIADQLRFLTVLESAVREAQTTRSFDYSPPEIPRLKLQPGPVMDSMINLENQARQFASAKARLRKGLETELQPLRERRVALRKKILAIQKSRQRKLLGMYLETSQEELGRSNAQIDTAENEAKLKIQQGLGDLLKSIRTVETSLDAYVRDRAIRSPIRGQLTKILIKENAAVDVNKPVAMITPENGKLIGAVRVPSRDIVRIAIGQKLRYKMEAYPPQTYGSFSGTVINFEQATGGEGAAAPGTGDYIVYGTIEYPTQLRAELKQNMKLVTGMRFDADVVIDRKPVTRIFWDMIFGTR